MHALFVFALFVFDNQLLHVIWLILETAAKIKDQCPLAKEKKTEYEWVSRVNYVVQNKYMYLPGPKLLGNKIWNNI